MNDAAPAAGLRQHRPAKQLGHGIHRRGLIDPLAGDDDTTSTGEASDQLMGPASYIGILTRCICILTRCIGTLTRSVSLLTINIGILTSCIGILAIWTAGKIIVGRRQHAGGTEQGFTKREVELHRPWHRPLAGHSLTRRGAPAGRLCDTSGQRPPPRSSRDLRHAGVEERPHESAVKLTADRSSAVPQRRAVPADDRR